MAIVALLAVLTGCATKTSPFIIGLYDVPPEHFQNVAAAGFNTVVSSFSSNTLEVARTNGLQIIAHPPSSEQMIRRATTHPALWGWYVVDEPDMHLISPPKVRRRSRDLATLSSKPSLVVLMSGASVEKYQDTATVVAVDWYPVPWAPVGTVSREMRLARLGAKGRPFFAVLQAFDWQSFPELLRTDAALRAPSSSEVRCMTYQALLQGAAGLLFYTYDHPKWKLYEHPELWSALSELAFELKRTAPIFSDRVEWWPVRTETHGTPADMYNEILEARVLLGLFRVREPTGSTQAGYYLVAINTSAMSSDFSFQLPFVGVQEFDSSCGAEGINVENDWVRKTYAPFEVCIFGPFQGRLRE